MDASRGSRIIRCGILSPGQVVMRAQAREENLSAIGYRVSAAEFSKLLFGMASFAALHLLQTI